MNQCLICSTEVNDVELQCKWCSRQCHFDCAFGRPVKKNTAYFSNGNFACPVCIVGRNNDLTLKAVSTNQIHIQNQHATDFVLNKTLIHDIADDITDDEDLDGTNDGEDKEEAAELVDETAAAEGDGGSVPVNSGDAITPEVIVAETPSQPSPTRRVDEEQVELEGFTPAHPGDVARSNRLSLILNTLKNLPDHKTTLILGDSNTHGVQGDKVDPESGTVAVRSFSGLCIVAAVLALKKYRYSYRNIKRLAWSLGTNDALHSKDHCSDDFEKYLKALYSESSRIFPQASISFILPFNGIPGVSGEFRKGLINALKIHCPKIWRCRPPSMVNKMKGGSVHINAEGKRAYINYLMANFTKCKPQQQSHPPARPPSHSSGRKTAGGKENLRTRGPPRVSGPPYVDRVPLPPHMSSSTPEIGTGQQTQAGHPSSMVHELAEALSHIMMIRRRGPQPYSTQGPWY